MTAQTPNAGAPTQPGMTGEQAADAGRAMFESARAQKEQIAQGFLAERDAVLKTVAEQQANIPTPADISGLATEDEKEAAQAAGYSQEEINAALQLMHANAGLDASAAPAQPAAPPQPVPAQQPAYSPPPQAQSATLQEIVQRLQLMIAAEVSVQLRAYGLVPVQPRPQAAQEDEKKSQNPAETLSQTDG